MDPEGLKGVQQALLAWFQAHARDLPWRRTRDPYAVLVAEVMLQQTQVDRVVPKYLAFLERFPTLETLARASAAEVLRAWAGLGYNRRALHLQRAARAAVERHRGRLPEEPDALRELGGIGPYTAPAIACFAYGRQAPVLDTNARRVLGRIFTGPHAVSDAALGRLALEVLPPGQAWAWNQALMDLGAMVCTAAKPRCLICPVRPHCCAAPVLQGGGRIAEARPPYRKSSSPYVGSSRYYRGRTVACLRALPPGATMDLPSLGQAVRPGFSEADLPWLLGLLRSLERDGLVALHGDPAGPPDQLRAALPQE